MFILAAAHDSDLSEAVPIVAIVFTFIWLIVKAIMAPLTERNKRPPAATSGQGGFSDDELVILDKLQRTLAKMESRVESLETILIEQTRSKEKYGSKL